ncbi:bifunctional 3-(3-hydroxy-phenyl)propionate/3-hydroxycinnamic acid hydroxylase [Streptomyces griseorubiginosus]|uniref:bifunctional 3-(3-hydroxy-phenyl)propionate/3-hydroxycinnamic acid hydroxylase n=1 Tax=Streptomyces griseorubiginosus TaxID=67304 RepID=UPI0011406155|nr:bifunctional 3-(3-hydroxy-phenyl)propionate/3-hydroxycinnamic acid hydroxylase [Streptomyces griseorubiginosus]
MHQDNEVLVVGGGPVGLMALMLLGHAGIRAVGVEREPDMWPHARAVHFSGEIMRLLQAVGLADEFAARSKPMRDVRMENEAGETLVALTAGHLGSQAWHEETLFHQPDLEALLRGEVARLPHVELRSGCTLVDLEQKDGAVRCRIRTQAGEEEDITARWVIGCDGAHSTVRQLLDIATENLGTDDPWLVVDGHLRGTDGIPGDMVVLGHHTRPALWVRLPDGRARMEFKVMPEDDPAALPTPESIARISRGVLTPDTFEPERRAIYTFRSRLATTWRVGNVFLAGDAAHQAPPLFGMGLCAGLRDVANLVWKLRLVSLGKAEENLLDTYEPERKAHARHWVETAANMAVVVQATDPVTAKQRDEFIRANPAASQPPPPPIGPGLHAGTEPAGTLSIQPVLADGRRLDDLVGRRFLVAARPELIAGLSPDTRALTNDTAEVALLTAPEEIDQLLASVDAPAVVIRPDRYILGTAHEGADLESLLQMLPTRPSTPTGDTLAR